MASHAKQIIDMPREQRKAFFDNEVPTELKSMVRIQVEKHFRKVHKMNKIAKK